MRELAVRCPCGGSVRVHDAFYEGACDRCGTVYDHYQIPRLLMDRLHTLLIWRRNELLFRDMQAQEAVGKRRNFREGDYSIILKEPAIVDHMLLFGECFARHPAFDLVGVGSTEDSALQHFGAFLHQEFRELKKAAGDEMSPDLQRFLEHAQILAHLTVGEPLYKHTMEGIRAQRRKKNAPTTKLVRRHATRKRRRP